jgi:hypothetical protein
MQAIEPIEQAIADLLRRLTPAWTPLSIQTQAEEAALVALVELRYVEIRCRVMMHRNDEPFAEVKATAVGSIAIALDSAISEHWRVRERATDGVTIDAPNVEAARLTMLGEDLLHDLEVYSHEDLARKLNRMRWKICGGKGKLESEALHRSETSIG